ncbi:MAG: MAPEG family protein [Pseudomonadota bacterium]
MTGQVPIELQILVWSAVLFVVSLLLAASGRTLTMGLDWAAGSRDETPGAVPQWGDRADRAFRNMRETFPLYGAFTVAVVAIDATSTMTAWGAVIYLVARVLYLPAYIFHVQFVRSLIWVASMLGIAMLGLPLLIGGA